MTVPVKSAFYPSGKTADWRKGSYQAPGRCLLQVREGRQISGSFDLSRKVVKVLCSKGEKRQIQGG